MSGKFVPPPTWVGVPDINNYARWLEQFNFEQTGVRGDVIVLGLKDDIKKDEHAS